MVVSASCYLEAFILARVSLHESHVFLALIVGAAGKLAVQLFYVPAQLFHSCKGLFGFLHYRLRVAQLHYLRKVAHRCVAAYAYRSSCGFLQSCQYLEQSGFSRAVLAYKRHAFPVANDKFGVAEKRARAEFH